MVRPVQGGTDKVVHARIHYDEILGASLLDIHHPGDQRAALRHDGATRLDMELVALPYGETAAQGLHPRLEVGDRRAVRILVVDTETSAEVDILNLEPVLLKPAH